MEVTENPNQKLSQYQGEKREIKIGVTRDGRSFIFRVPGIEQPFFKAVAYIEKVIESAKQRQASTAYNAEQIKG